MKYMLELSGDYKIAGICMKSDVIPQKDSIINIDNRTYRVVNVIHHAYEDLKMYYLSKTVTVELIRI